MDHHEPEVWEILLIIRNKFMLQTTTHDYEESLIKEASTVLAEAYNNAYVSPQFYQHQLNLVNQWILDKCLVEIQRLPVKEKAYKDYQF